MDFELPNSLGRTCADVESRFLASDVKSSLLSGMLDQLGCRR